MVQNTQKPYLKPSLLHTRDSLTVSMKTSLMHKTTAAIDELKAMVTRRSNPFTLHKTHARFSKREEDPAKRVETIDDFRKTDSTLCGHASHDAIHEFHHGKDERYSFL